MFTRLRILSAFAFIAICSSALAVTGSTTFTVGTFSGANGFSIDNCGGSNFGSVATPTLSDGRTICGLFEFDLFPFGNNVLWLEINGFTSDPGSNYFNQLNLSCGFSLGAAGAGYSYGGGEALWTWNLSASECIVGSTGSLSID
jgi:hypothetical protein